MYKSRSHARARILVALCLAATAFWSAQSPGSADPTWAPAATAAIHPGVQTMTGGGQCTSNFIFFDATDVYIGQAAHCSGTGGNTATNGCTSGSLPLGTEVEVSGASHPGVMVYNSWLTMQQQGVTDPDVCQYNDLALVRLDPADRAKVNPSIPHWGGPVGIATAGTATGDRVYSYGNSSLRFGITQLSPKTGISLGDDGNGWSHAVYTVSPGIPGDSGSAFLSPDGKALGVLSTLAIAPVAGSNGVGDVSRELTFLQQQPGFTGIAMALGTEPFTPSKPPLGI